MHYQNRFSDQEGRWTWRDCSTPGKGNLLWHFLAFKWRTALDYYYLSNNVELNSQFLGRVSTLSWAATWSGPRTSSRKGRMRTLSNSARSALEARALISLCDQLPGAQQVTVWTSETAVGWTSETALNWTSEPVLGWTSVTSLGVLIDTVFFARKYTC